MQGGPARGAESGGGGGHKSGGKFVSGQDPGADLSLCMMGQTDCINRPSRCVSAAAAGLKIPEPRSLPALC